MVGQPIRTFTRGRMVNQRGTLWRRQAGGHDQRVVEVDQPGVMQRPRITEGARSVQPTSVPSPDAPGVSLACER